MKLQDEIALQVKLANEWRPDKKAVSFENRVYLCKKGKPKKLIREEKNDS